MNVRARFRGQTVSEREGERALPRGQRGLRIVGWRIRRALLMCMMGAALTGVACGRGYASPAVGPSGRGVSAVAPHAEVVPHHVVAPPSASPWWDRWVRPWADFRFVRTMQRGQESYERGHYQAAEKAFGSAGALRPNSVAAREAQGEALYRARKYAEAARCFQQGLEAAPRGARDRLAYNLGNALYRQQKLPEAASAYEKALRWNENDGDARHNLALVLEKLQKQQNKQQKQDQQKQNKSQQKQDQQKQNKSQQKQGKQKQNKSQQKAGQGKKQQQSAKGAVQKRQPHGKPSPAHRSGAKHGAKHGAKKGHVPSTAVGKRAPARSARMTPAQMARAARQARRRNTERILQYFQQKERESRDLPTPTAPNIPPPGGATW